VLWYREQKEREKQQRQEQEKEERRRKQQEEEKKRKEEEEKRRKAEKEKADKDKAAKKVTTFPIRDIRVDPVVVNSWVFLCVPQHYCILLSLHFIFWRRVFC